MQHIVIPAMDWRESSAMEGNFNICKGIRAWRVTPKHDGVFCAALLVGAVFDRFGCCALDAFGT
ncbi:MAG: hypothetical protein ABFS45_04180 [Pseudomonadota bacterium]